MFTCTKNHTNWFRHSEDISSQTRWPYFLAHPVYPTALCLQLLNKRIITQKNCKIIYKVAKMLLACSRICSFWWRVNWELNKSIWKSFCKFVCHGNVPWAIRKTGLDLQSTFKYLPFGERNGKISLVDPEIIGLQGFILKWKKINASKIYGQVGKFAKQAK